MFEFLNQLSPHYEIFFFSSRRHQILDTLITQINNRASPEKKIIVSKKYFSRKNCSLTENKKLIKDLFLIKDRHIKDIIFLDYKAESLAFNLGNLVLIPFWSGEPVEKVLEGYLEYLKNLAKFDDCRKKILKDMDYGSFMSLLDRCEYAVA